MPHFSIKACGARVQVSGYIAKPGALLTWTKGWKTEIISQVYQIEDGDFIDVGANVGQTLLDYQSAGIKRRYIGFEPNPIAYASIHTFLQDNAFLNCIVLPIGLSDTTAVLNLYSEAFHDADVNATIIPDLRPRMVVDYTSIYCCPFDELLRPLAISSIGLIKIDVEGAELAVLRGMEQTLRTMRVLVLCEILYSDESADIEQHKKKLEETASFLRQMDYVSFRVVVDKQLGRLQKLMRMEEFPVKVWSVDNQHECDYVLVPAEKAARFAEMSSTAT